MAVLKEKSRDFVALITAHKTLEKDYEYTSKQASESKALLLKTEGEVAELSAKHASEETQRISLQKERDTLASSLSVEEKKVLELNKEVSELKSLKRLYANSQDQLKSQAEQYQCELREKERAWKE